MAARLHRAPTRLVDARTLHITADRRSPFAVAGRRTRPAPGVDDDAARALLFLAGLALGSVLTLIAIVAARC